MKFFVALALAAVAVSALEYGSVSSSSSSFYYVQPQLPCAYSLTVTQRQSYYSSTTATFKVLGRFIYQRIPYSSYSYTTAVTRPDIHKMVNGTKQMAVVYPSSYTCSYVEIEKTVQNMEDYVVAYIDGFNNRSYVHKDPVTINEKECEVYYDDDATLEAMYVCDEFVYRIVNSSIDITLNYTWGEPEMDEFVVSSTYSGCSSKITTTPSKKYAHCSLTSSSSSSYGAYTYLQPTYPCAFEVKISSSETSAAISYKFDGNYMYRQQGSSVIVSRPDIRLTENGTEKMAVFQTSSSSYSCYMDYYQINTSVASMHAQIWGLTDGYNNRTYYHKESVTIDKLHYDLYYDEDKDDEVIYVHRGYIYKVHDGLTDVTFAYKWFQPETSEFTLDKTTYPYCGSYDEKIYSVPSRAYANCVIPVPPSLDSSVRAEAMIFAVIAVIAASLVALF